MKIILLSSLAILTLPLFANEAKLIRVTATKNPPKKPVYDFISQHMGYSHGCNLTFLIEGKNLVSFDKKSLVAKGWWLDSFPEVSADGTNAIFTITNNSNFMDTIDKLKASGTITLNYTKNTEKITAAASVTEEQNLGPFTVQLAIKGTEFNRMQITKDSVFVKGDFEMVKKVTVKQDGEELGTTGWRGGMRERERQYYFKGIKDGALVSIEYWGDPKKVTYKFSK